MLYTNNNINNEKIKWAPSIIKISDNSFIKKIDLEKRGNSFCDIIFNNNGKEIFVGRYGVNVLSNVKVLYKNGRILVYSDKFINEKERIKITKVYTLYDVVDDMCYSMKEEELLNLFDQNLDTSYLKKNNKLAIRSDVEKIHRLRK